jgi:hypothetical protein
MVVGVFTIVPMVASAQVISGGTVNNASTSRFSLDTETGLLTYSGSGTASASWAVNSQGLIPYVKNAVVESGISELGPYSLGYFSNLESITISATVNSIHKTDIGGSSVLSSITVDENNNTYMSEDNVIYSKDQSTLIRYAPGKPDTSFTIPNGVTKIEERAFDGCSNLTSINIPNSVTGRIGSAAFNGCSSLTSIYIPDGVTGLGDAVFQGCSNLETVFLSENVSSIGSACFNGCSNLESIVIPASVTTINSNAFNDCNNLTTIFCEEGSAAAEFFADNPNVEVASYDPDQTCGANAFWSFNEDTGALYVFGTGNMNNYSGGQTPWYSLIDSISTIAVAAGITNVGNYAFNNCANATKATLGDSVKSIGNAAFQRCTSLEEVNIPEGVTEIGFVAFYDCTSLNNVTIPSTVGSLGWLSFGYCTDLSIAVVNSRNTSFGSANVPQYGGNVYPFSGSDNLTIFGYPDSSVKTHCVSRSIDFENIYTTDDDTNVIVGEAIEHEADDQTWLKDYSLNNLGILGVQKRADSETDDMRFVAAVNNDIIQDADEYGFIVGKSAKTDVAEARGYAEKAKYGEDENCATIDCKGTSNKISEKFGWYASDTPYKYVTLAVENVPDDQTLVVRFYVKKGNNIWYSRYQKDQTVYKNFYKGLAVNWDAINNA